MSNACSASRGGRCATCYAECWGATSRDRHRGRSARRARGRTRSASNSGSPSERRISPELGSSERSTWRSGFQRSERISAFEHCVYASSTDDEDPEPRHLALDRARREQLGVVDDRRAAVDAERVADAGDQEEQRDARVLEQVRERVREPVAWPLGQQQRPLVEDPTKPAGSPRGETSRPPSGRAVATHTNGERSTNWRVSSLSRPAIFPRTTSVGEPIASRSARSSRIATARG